jgi:hypothetical protein
MSFLASVEVLPAQRGQEHIEHVGLALGVERLERDHKARCLVEHRVDAERPGGRTDPQRPSMTHVAAIPRTG